MDLEHKGIVINGREYFIVYYDDETTYILRDIDQRDDWVDRDFVFEKVENDFFENEYIRCDSRTCYFYTDINGKTWLIIRDHFAQSETKWEIEDNTSFGIPMIKERTYVDSLPPK